jgi:hypothetical protein
MSLVVVWENLPPGAVGATYGGPNDITLAVYGNVGSYVFTVSAGSLPPGISIVSSKYFVGNPTTTGVYTFSILVTDSASNTATAANLIICVNSALLLVGGIELPSLGYGSILGTIGSSTLMTRGAISVTGGTAPVSYAITSGGMSPGLSFNTLTGAITGTPTAIGSFNYTWQFTDANGAVAIYTPAYYTYPYPPGGEAGSIIIAPSSSPAITCGSPPNGSVFVPYSHDFSLTTSGGTPPYTFSVLSGALPTGVTLNASTGVISGTPTTIGTFTFVIEVTDSASATANTGTCLITIGRPATVNAGGGGGGGPSQSSQPTQPGLYEQLCSTSLTVDTARKRVPTLGSLLKMSSMNQFAQPQLRSNVKSNKFVDCDVTLVFNYQIGAYAQIVGLQQPISAEGDFYLCAMQASSVIQQRPDLQEYAGSVSIRIADDVGYRLMDDYITMNFLTEMAGNPWPFVIKPAHFFRAGTKIWIDMQENSGFLSNVQVSFRGRYRYRAVGGGK